MNANAIIQTLRRHAPAARAATADAAALLARLTIGQAFLLTGIGKLRDLESTAGFFATLGLPAPGAHALGVGLAEAIGGALLLLGLAVRPSALVLIATMLGAIATAHRGEFAAALGIAPEHGLTDVVPWMFALVLLPLLAHGGGRVSLDAALRRWFCGRSCVAGPAGAATT